MKARKPRYVDIGAILIMMIEEQREIHRQKSTEESNRKEINTYIFINDTSQAGTSEGHEDRISPFVSRKRELAKQNGLGRQVAEARRMSDAMKAKSARVPVNHCGET
jgi:hypothetical protein